MNWWTYNEHGGNGLCLTLSKHSREGTFGESVRGMHVKRNLIIEIFNKEIKYYSVGVSIKFFNKYKFTDSVKQGKKKLNICFNHKKPIKINFGSDAPITLKWVSV